MCRSKPSFLRLRARSLPFLVALGLVACGAPSVHDDDSVAGDSDGSGGKKGTGSTTGTDGDDEGDGGSGASSGSGSSNSGSGSTSSSGGGTAGSGGASSAPALMPARIRRLTNAEYTRSVQELLGTSIEASAAFPPDARQQGYTVNEAQRVDPLLAIELDAVARILAAEARPQFGSLAPCENTQGGRACAETFIDSFGQKAYRRPLSDDDKASLLALYEAGAEGAAYEDGIELVIRGVLQSPGFLYLTEIGEGTGDGTVTLTSYEIAAELAYILSGGPPDQELLQAVTEGSLMTPEGREAQVRRLFASEMGRKRATQLVREWLGIDRILQTGKDNAAYPDFTDELRQGMWSETELFVGDILDSSAGNVVDLLGSNLDRSSGKLTSLYQAENGPSRRGLLNQGAFLSVFAHANESAPVMRGVAVLRRVACMQMPSPTNLMVQIVPPLPDPDKTTRDRYAIHSADDQCSLCHDLIDPIGFSFEGFDGIGKHRKTENQKAVNSAVEIEMDVDFDGAYPDSNALAEALATSPSVIDCFGTQVFRAAAGEGQNASGYERSFRDVVSSLPAESRGTLLELMVAFARSPLFIERRPE